MGLLWTVDIGTVDQLVGGKRMSRDGLARLDVWRMEFERTLDGLDGVYCYHYRYGHIHYHDDEWRNDRCHYGDNVWGESRRGCCKRYTSNDNKGNNDNRLFGIAGK